MMRIRVSVMVQTIVCTLCIVKGLYSDVPLCTGSVVQETQEPSVLSTRQGYFLLDTSLVGMAASQREPAVASNGTDYFVVWRDSSTSSRIHGIRVGNTGAILDTCPIVFEQYSGEHKAPHVIWAGSLYAVAWRVEINPYDHVYVARVTDAGHVVLTQPLVSSLEPIVGVDVGSDGTNVLVCYDQYWEDQGACGWRVAGILQTAGGSYITYFAIPSGMDYLGHPRIAFDGVNYLVVYRHSYYTTDVTTIDGYRVSQSGSPVGPEINISNDNGADNEVAFDGENYLVVWHEEYYGYGYRILGRRVSPAGVSIGDVFFVCDANDSQMKPAIGFDGTDFWVVWQDNRNGEWDIYGAKVGMGSNVWEEFPVSLQPGDQVEPAIARGPDDQLLITYSGWTDEINGQPVNTMRIWGILSTDVGVEETQLPVAIGEERLSIVPNPFYGRVNIRYRAPANISDAITLKIYNAAGQVVREFNKTPSNTDAISLVWDGTDKQGRTLPQGIYFVNLTAGDCSETEKVIFIK